LRKHKKITTGTVIVFPR